jgi:hypothetical protein
MYYTPVWVGGVIGWVNRPMTREEMKRAGIKTPKEDEKFKIQDGHSSQEAPKEQDRKTDHRRYGLRRNGSH